MEQSLLNPKNWSCNNCAHLYYDPDDEHEYQKCHVVGHTDEYFTNQRALEESLRRMDANESLPMCECYIPRLKIMEQLEKSQEKSDKSD